MVSFNGKVFAIGGLIRGAPVVVATNSVEVLRGKNWSTAPPMLQSRSKRASVVIGAYLYVLGGCAEWVSLDQCERFDCKKWTAIAPMSHKRKLHTAVVYRGQIHVIGGEHDKTGTIRCQNEHVDHDALHESAAQGSPGNCLEKQTVRFGWAGTRRWFLHWSVGWNEVVN